MHQTSTRLRRIGVGSTVGALAASALLFAPAQAADVAITSVRESHIAKDATKYEGWHQGAVNAGVPGEHKITNEGLELTGRSQVLNGYPDNKIIDIDNGNKNVELSKLSAAKLTVPQGAASFQVPLFYKDGDVTRFATLRTPPAAGGEVGTGDWQASRDIGDIAAGTSAPLSSYIEKIGTTYKVIGFGVYNETGTTVVKDLTFDDTKYLFSNAAPTVSDRQLTTKINRAISVPLTAIDIDGNTLAYEITGVLNGTVSGSGADRTFTPTRNFTGTSAVKYTVTDGRGGVSTATVTIKVSKFSSKVAIYRVHPATNKITTKSKVFVYATVSVDGKPASRGSTVYLYAKGKKVRSGKVNSYGKVKIALPNKLPKGKSTLKITKVGTTTANGSSASVVVRIKK